MSIRSYISPRPLSLFIVFTLVLLIIVQAQAAPVGQGSYTTTLPAGKRGPSICYHPDPYTCNLHDATPKITADFTGPVQTNDWWSSLIWGFHSPVNAPGIGNPYSENMYPHPLAIRARADGLRMSYFPQPNGYQYVFGAEDLNISVVGLNASAVRVADYSDWAVTARWDDGSRRMDVTAGRGFPFVYVTKSGGNASVQVMTGYEGTWYNSGGVLGLKANGRYYAVFGPAGSTWSGSGSGPYTSSLNGKDFFSVAVLPDNSATTREFFRQHAYAFVTDTQVSWSYSAANANLQTTYTVSTVLKESGNGNVNRPLQALYRHQWLNTGSPLTSYIYPSPRGEMKVFDGASFSTNMAFTGVLPALPDAGTYDRTQLYNYVNDVYVSGPYIDSGDTYWGGKDAGRLAQLVWIANQVGHTAARNAFLNELKAKLEDWLDADDGGSKLFYYNATWDTLIGFPESFGTNTELNDHDFHWGYWVMAAATVANFDSNWASESNWGGMVELLIKDAANWDRNDTMFPFLRSFDPYAGHGWANGPAGFGDGNNQESSSEAMNFATGVILWGAATGDTQVRNLGIYLHTNMMHAIQQYWFDVNEVVFPASYNHEVVGILWDTGGAYGTWWTGNPEEIHGINFLPFTGGSLYLGQYSGYVTRNYNHLVAQNGGQEVEWRDIIWNFQALADPSAALSKFGSGNYTPEDGESKAHTYHWLHNLNAMGQVDTSITADTPTYAVFNKSGTRTYVAYNPGSASLDVHFSDGKCLTVAPKTIAYASGSPSCGGVTPTPTATMPVTSTPTPTPSGDYTQGVDYINNSTARIWFKPTTSAAWVDVHYTVNGGGQLNYRMMYNSGNGRWEQNVTGLSNGNVINYSFTYFTNVGHDTGWFSYTHGNGPTPTPTSTPTITPTPSGNYTQGVDRVNGSTARIWFDPTTSAAWVDVHYTVNGGGQLNYRMTYNSGNGRWEQDVTGLSSGSVINYSFTYFTNVGYDTGWFTYTHQ